MSSLVSIRFQKLINLLDLSRLLQIDFYKYYRFFFVVFQSLSCVWLCDPMGCSTLGFPFLHHLPEFAQIQVHWVGDAIQPSYPLSLPLLLPSIIPISRVFFNESSFCIRWSKYWSFNFSISPSSEYSGLISFRIDWFGLKNSQESSLAPQFKGISSSALSLFYCPALIPIHDYWNNHSFDYTITLSAKWYLLFSMLSRFVIAFLSRSKSLLISWLQSPSTVILEPKQIKSVSLFFFTCMLNPSFCAYRDIGFKEKYVSSIFLDQFWFFTKLCKIIISYS